MNVNVDPRGGRNKESPSEDPYHGGQVSGTSAHLCVVCDTETYTHTHTHTHTRIRIRNHAYTRTWNTCMHLRLSKTIVDTTRGGPVSRMYLQDMQSVRPFSNSFACSFTPMSSEMSARTRPSLLQYGAELVKGIQGVDVSPPMIKMAAALKHFAVYVDLLASSRLHCVRLIH